MKLVPSKDLVKIKLKGRDMNLDGAGGQTVMSMSILLGTDPASDDCVTARRLGCEPKEASVSCKN
jgi:hypothetical protein